MEVLSLYWPGETEEDGETRISGVPDDIETECILNTSLERYWNPHPLDDIVPTPVPGDTPSWRGG